jgi:glycerol-3-phosphate acyltransferase PlsX
MGGDFAPKNIVLGAIQAYMRIQPKTRLVLFGDREQIAALCKAEGFDVEKFDIVHTSQVIGMNEHPAKAFQQKTDSSITVGFNALVNLRIDGFASAGSTGAMLAGAMYTIKAIPGIIRPAIAGGFPVLSGSIATILDVGLNVDCKPDILYQYGLLGSIYARHTYTIEKPRVALLNIGEEEEKGNLQTKEAYKLMQDSTEYNFVGNIEANQMFTGNIADVIVADGFVGNVVLKQAEAMYYLTKKQGIDNDYFNRFNYELHGGTPVLGVNAPIVIGHGASSPKAVENMILQTEHAIQVRLIDKITEALEQ